MSIPKYLSFVKTRYPLCCNLILGIILVLAFKPVNLWPLGVLVPTLLLWLWRREGAIQNNGKNALLAGFMFGLGLFGAGASWIYVSIATYGNTNWLVAVGVTLLFIAVLALFPAIQAYTYQRFFARFQNVNALIIFPSTWVVLEWLRGALFTGFPWLYLGYTQTFTVFAGWAKIFGVYGVSWLCGFLGACIYLCCLSGTTKRVKTLAVLAILLSAVLGYGLRQHQFTKPLGAPQAVLLVQGNIPQEEKWNPRNLDHILSTYAKLTGPYLNTPLIVWPENAVPAFPGMVLPFLQALGETARLFNSAVIIGIPLSNATGKIYYNGALALGAAQGMYLKRHLVPFGEYVPFEKELGPLLQFLHIPMSDFDQGPAQQALLNIHGVPVAIFICYESAYPLAVRAYLHQAAYVITLTDDSWFGHSFAPYEQEEMEAMRALELERPFIRATNTGITSIINSNGKITATAPMFRATILQGTVQAMAGSTPWLKHGPWYLLLWLLVMYAGACIYAYTHLLSDTDC